MAITKLLRLKETKGANRASHLKNNLFYICNPEKTSGGIWIGGNAGTTPENIYSTMMMNKNYWGKESGTQGFHYVLSFLPEQKIDEAMAYGITEDFCQELLGDSFYYCIAVHNDKPHMHVHVTFDSVSRLDGYKFHSPKGDWEKRIQPITDRICRKYGIPTLSYEKEKSRGMDYGSWKDGKDSQEKQMRRYGKGNREDGSRSLSDGRGEGVKRQKYDQSDDGRAKSESSEFEDQVEEIPKFNWYDIIRDDIDDAIEASDSYEEFLENLRRQHYELRDKKYLSLKPFGKERSVRSIRLGNEYSKERIIERIAGRKHGMEFRRYGNYEKLSEAMGRYKIENGNPTVYQKQFYYRVISTVNIRHPVFYDYENWKYKKDVLNLYLYNRQINYVLQNRIRSKEDAERKRLELAEEIHKIEKERKRLRSSLIPESNYYRMKKLLSIQEELKKYPDGSRDDLMEQAKVLIEKITLSESLDEAFKRFNSVNQVLDDIALAYKKIGNELKLVEVILGEDFKRRDYRTFKSQKSDHDAGQRIRITLNRKLFADDLNKTGYRVFRIPGTKKHVAIPVKHTVRVSERTVAAFIYPEDEYQISNEAGEEIGRIRGDKLRTYFENGRNEQRREKRQLPVP